MSRAPFELEPEIVRAGAGAGKTQALTEKVLMVAKSIIASGNKNPRLVVTTFTKKATEELRERLLKQVCAKDDAELFRFISSGSNLQISTLHGIVAVFLRRYGHWLGMDTGFSFLSNDVAEKLAKSVLRDLLVDEQRFEVLLSNFNIQQLVRYLRKISLQWVEIGSVTPASAEIIAKCSHSELKLLLANLHKTLQNVKCETVDAKWCDYIKSVEVQTSQLVSLDPEMWQHWLETFQDLKKPRYSAKAAVLSEDLNEELKLRVSELVDFVEQAEIVKSSQLYADQSTLFVELVEKFTAEFTARKMSVGQIEMSDLEILALKSIRERPEIAKAFSSDWDFWLIDEFQDTSPTQVEILKFFVGEKPTYVVGDPQQSIYLFRGSRSEVFDRQEATVKDAGGRLSQLMKNYRSTPSLLYFFNDFFSQFNSPEVNRFMPMQSRSNDFKSDAVVAKFCVTKHKAKYPYASVATEILKKFGEGRPFEHNCILARTNHELKDIAMYLESLQIPTHIHASEGFYSRREILDLLSLIKFLLNPHDNLNFVRLVRSPWYKVSDEDLVHHLVSRPVSYWVHFNNCLANHDTISRLRLLLDTVQKCGLFQVLLNEVVESGIVDYSHLHDSTGRRESNIWKLLSILQENERSPGFSYMGFAKSVFQTLESGQSDEEIDAVAALEPNRVNLMTIHKSKGLKFKHVFLPNLHKRLTTTLHRSHQLPFLIDEESGLFTMAIKIGEEDRLCHNYFAKEIMRKMADREHDEQLRVLYVALTRAEESVFMHWCENPPELSLAGQIKKWDCSFGIHAREQYSYEVFNCDDIQPTLHSIAEVDKPLRPIYQDIQSLESKGKKRLSVTSLVESNDVEASANTNYHSPATEELKKQLSNPVMGKKMHLFLEKLKYSDQPNIAEFAAKWFGDKTQDFIEGFNFVVGIKDPPILHLIQHGEVEWGFQLQTSQGVIEGQIDLWGQESIGGGNKRTWIVDYKTGSERHSARAFSQLNLYALALREYGITDPISLAVIYALEKKVKVQEAQPSAQIKLRYQLD